MRTTFCLDHNHRLVSAIRPRSVPHALRVGWVLSLLCPFDTPWGLIPAGITAAVESVREEDGTVELHVAQYVPALEPWGRCIVLMPYATDDLSSTMKLEAVSVVHLEEELA